MITASSLERIAVCPSSVNLPQFGRQTEWTKAGNVLHKFMEDSCAMGAAAALENVPPEFLEACQILALESLPTFQPGAFAAEVAFAFNIHTFECRELGRGIGREYIKHGAHPTNDICGSVDLVGVSDEDDSVTIVDWKLGRTQHAPTSMQMKYLGMVAANAYGKSKAHVLIYHMCDGDVTRVAGVLDVFQFAEIQQELVAIERVASSSGTSTLVVSEQCRFCPAMAGCPAQARMVNALSLEGGSAMTAADLAATLTVDSVKRAWALKKAAELALERIGEACKLFASTTPVTLDSGKVLGPCEQEKESIDAGVVHRLLGKTYGVEVADQVVAFSVTKTDLDAALKAQAVASGTKFAGLKRDFYQKIRDAGGSRTRTVTSVREHAAKGKE